MTEYGVTAGRYRLDAERLMAAGQLSTECDFDWAHVLIADPGLRYHPKAGPVNGCVL